MPTRSSEPASSTMLRGQNPLIKAATRTSAETTVLASQRMQAMMAAPSRLLACRTPFDMLMVQMQFLQQATDQYNSSVRNIQAAWSPVIPALAAWSMAIPAPVPPLPHTIPRSLSLASSRREMPPERDIITFREPIETVVRQREAA